MTQRTHNPLYPAIGMHLRAVRQKAGLYQDDVAALLGLRRAQISYYELGQVRMPMALFVRWCQELHIDPGDTLNQVVALHKMRQKVRDE